jgi:hypothetical protein
MFDNYEDFFKNSDADIEELTYGQMMQALGDETDSYRHEHTSKTHHHVGGPEQDFHVPAFPTKAQRLIDGNYYEWIEAETKWIKIIEDSPEPPSHWEPGLFDGEIRKHIPE